MIRTPVPPEPRKQLSKKHKAEIVARQKGRCTMCGKPLRAGHMIFDHWHSLELGGADDPANINAICDDPCNKTKTAADAKAIAKGRRLRAKADGTWRPKRKKIRGPGFDKRHTRTFRGETKERTGPAVMR